ncbi:CDP-diacylglycerol--inositol 3-phosphatidyltransferase isoform X2 [Leucoraja erinacea]|uniref:CDP-diacylglycerol--inositol 3-phosphatidyltransferase isoform X2 n=1 Tax=Leucoraja erinaceus TaxID=7782 RepID=UPI0024559150|nr:CDP-diacylglycerol--inositol 3-phosphatidyltransferase isoform X2 [Leucoraja erinacea]
MAENIYLFVPNIIGYVRILLALLSFWLMPHSPVGAITCYGISTLLDSVDGHAARLLDQCTRLGAMMDMLTDRCSTFCLMFTLCIFYPSYAFIFQVSAALDIASHWLHLHSVTLQGAGSHKQIDQGGNSILRYYYSNKAILFLMCVGNELFYMSLYVLYFTEGWMVPVVGGDLSLRPILWACLPVAVAKSGVNVVHLVSAARTLVAIDHVERARGGGGGDVSIYKLVLVCVG